MLQHPGRDSCKSGSQPKKRVESLSWRSSHCGSERTHAQAGRAGRAGGRAGRRGFFFFFFLFFGIVYWLVGVCAFSCVTRPLAVWQGI